MNKKILVGLLELTGKTEEDINKLIVEQKKELKEVFAIDNEEDLEAQAINRVYALFAKKSLSSKQDYEGMIFNFGQRTDYGALDKFMEIKMKFDNGDDIIKRGLYDAGMIDEEGNPLWCPANSGAKFKYEKNGVMLQRSQRKIIPENENRVQGLALLKKDGDTNFIPALITVYGNNEFNIPIKQRIRIKLGGRFDENAGLYRLSLSSDNIEFVVLNDMEISYDDYKDLVKTFFSNLIVDINEISPQQFLIQNSNMPFCFIEGGIVTKVTDLMDSEKSNIINLGSALIGLSGEGQITCFVPNTFQLPFEGQSEIIVAGKFGGDENLTFNVMDMISKFKPKKMQIIEPEKQQNLQPKTKPSWLQ